MTKLSPDDSVDWIIVSKPILTAAVNDAAFHTFQNIPGKQQTGFAALVLEKFKFKWLRNFSKPCFSKEFLSGATRTVPRRNNAIKARSIDFSENFTTEKEDELVMPKI